MIDLLRFALGRALVLTCAAGAPLAAGPAQAQPAPIEWELLGRPSQLNINGLAFAPGPSPDGSTDTLYAFGDEGVWRRPPGGPISSDLHVPTGGPQVAVRTKEGHLLVGSQAGPAANGHRSADYGRTWEGEVIPPGGISALFQSTLPALHGAVYAESNRRVRFSTAGGAPGTWAFGGLIGAAAPPGAEVDAFAEVPESASLPPGRLLAATIAGLAYSDDGGRTWALSSLWQPGRFRANDLAVAADPQHPYGGTAYAAVTDMATERPSVYASDDGGATWALRHTFEAGAFGLDLPHYVRLVAGPGGSLWAGLERIGGGDQSPGTVAVSADGGATWAEAGGYERVAPLAMEVGRDGRLYVGTDGAFGAGSTGGAVWRTVHPLPVAAEPTPAPPAGQGLRLGAGPNPARGTVAVTLSLPAPVPVRLAAYDALGREVAVLHDGLLVAGPRPFAWDASELPPGVYFLRATAGAASVTRAVTLAR